MAIPDKPNTREEHYLASMAGQEVDLPQPIPRVEKYLAKAAGMDVETPDPLTRVERYLDVIAESGGGSSVTVEPLIVTQNGTTTAPSGKAYSPVTVDVPAPASAVNYVLTWDGNQSKRATKTYNTLAYYKASEYAPTGTLGDLIVDPVIIVTLEGGQTVTLPGTLNTSGSLPTIDVSAGGRTAATAIIDNGIYILNFATIRMVLGQKVTEIRLTWHRAGALGAADVGMTITDDDPLTVDVSYTPPITIQALRDATYTSNVESESVLPAAGYDAMAEVVVTVAVPTGSVVLSAPRSVEDGYVAYTFGGDVMGYVVGAIPGELTARDLNISFNTNAPIAMIGNSPSTLTTGRYGSGEYQFDTNLISVDRFPNAIYAIPVE